MDEIRKRVRQLHRDGVDLFKVMASGGRMTAGSNDRAAQYTVEELTALVQEARRLQKTVAAHGHGTAGISTAVAAGVNVIEHCTWISPEASNRVSYDERVAEQMAEQGIFMDPTLSSGVRNLRADPATLTPRQRRGASAASLHPGSPPEITRTWRGDRGWYRRGRRKQDDGQLCRTSCGCTRSFSACHPPSVCARGPSTWPVRPVSKMTLAPCNLAGGPTFWWCRATRWRT